MGILGKLFGRTPAWDDEPMELQVDYVRKHFDALRQHIETAMPHMGQTAQALQESLLGIVQLGPECDELPLAFGPFGTVDTNPIPVNGPVGELVYLSRLKGPTGCRFFFHRLGSRHSKVYAHPIDEFELLSFDGSTAMHLFMAMYHPRRSQRVPAGCGRASWRRMANYEKVMCKLPISGTTSRVPDFPWGLPALIRENRELTAISPSIADSIARSIDDLLQRLRACDRRRRRGP